MKNTPLTAILLGALVVSVLAAAVLFWFYYQPRYRELRDLQGRMQTEVVAIQRNKAFLQSLAGDLQEYSKTHKEIDQLLEEAGVKQGKTAPSVPAPSPKPATK